MLGWLSKSEIPGRVTVCISLPDSEAWQADFLGALYPLSLERNWEEHGTLTSLEMSDEWRSVFFDFVEGTCSVIPIGSILPFAGQSAPGGYLLCHGQTVIRADYPDLFGVIGTIYGASVSGTEFNIPDLRHQVPVGVDEDGPAGFDIGDIGGELTHVLTIAEMPSHNHLQNSHNHAVFGDLFAATGTAQRKPNVATGGADVTSGSTTATNQATGDGGAHNNLQPYLALNYIIKY